MITMLILNKVITYLSIGVILMLFFDWTNRRLIEDGFDEEDLGPFTNRERFFVILLWPYSLFVFIKAFLYGDK
jgi:hypothetical protein